MAVRNKVCSPLRVIADTLQVPADRFMVIPSLGSPDRDSVIDTRKKSSPSSGTRISARVWPAVVCYDGPTDTMVYLPRWNRRHRMLRACRVPRSRLGSNRFEGHSGMMRAMHCLDRRCGIRSSLKLFPKRDHVLFSIPRSLTLSTRSCALLDLFGSDSWTSFQLHKGWAGLILCMMWEESRVEKSKWFHYLGVS